MEAFPRLAYHGNQHFLEPVLLGVVHELVKGFRSSLLLVDFALAVVAVHLERIDAEQFGISGMVDARSGKDAGRFAFPCSDFKDVSVPLTIGQFVKELRFTLEQPARYGVAAVNPRVHDGHGAGAGSAAAFAASDSANALALASAAR